MLGQKGFKNRCLLLHFWYWLTSLNTLNTKHSPSGWDTEPGRRCNVEININLQFLSHFLCKNKKVCAMILDRNDASSQHHTSCLKFKQSRSDLAVGHFLRHIVCQDTDTVCQHGEVPYAAVSLSKIATAQTDCWLFLSLKPTTKTSAQNPKSAPANDADFFLTFPAWNERRSSLLRTESSLSPHRCTTNTQTGNQSRRNARLKLGSKKNNN